MTGQWLPIESAPRDGTAILVSLSWVDSCPEFFDIRVYRWHSPWKEWVQSGPLFRHDEVKPTHWMPLPEPPAVATTNTRSE